MPGKKFTKSHEWIDLTGNKAKVGITNYAQNELGDIVYIELPEKNSEIKKGSSFAVVESVKTASDIYAPCSGKVTQVNESLLTSPQIINEDAQGQGWLVELELNDLDELKNLLNEEEYKKII